MFTQNFHVLMEGHTPPYFVVADQRDLSQLELQPWHTEGLTVDDQGRQVGPRRVTTNLRFMAYSAMRRAGYTDAEWPVFNLQLCIDVEALDDDPAAPDADPNPGGPVTSSAGSWSSSPS